MKLPIPNKCDINFSSEKKYKINYVAREQSMSISNWKLMVDIKKMVYDNSPSPNEALLTAIIENWNHFDKGPCYK